MRFGGFAIALAVVLVVTPGLAVAQDCPPPPPDLYPADGAPNVPVNGVVRVVFHQQYEPDVELDQLLRLFDEDDEQVSGAVTVEQDGGETLVELVTDDSLEPSTSYRAVVVLPEFGGEQEFEFTTGQDVDDSAPIFSGASKIRVVPASDVSCVEPSGPVPPQEAELEETGRGYRVTVTFPQAQDQAGAANIDYLLIQTSGPTLDEPWLRKRVRTFGSDSLFGAVFLPHAAVARQEICFEVHAEDMFGNRIEPGREACGDPVGPGYFRSMCAIAGAGLPGGTGIGGLIVGVAALSVARRRSRRRS